MIGCNKPLGTFKYITTNSSNSDGYQTLLIQYDKLDILLVAEVFRASETGEQRLNQLPAPPV